MAETNRGNSPPPPPPPPSLPPDPKDTVEPRKIDADTKGLPPLRS